MGIVSHVTELKERIDKKIIVTKKRTEDGVGSTIRIENWEYNIWEKHETDIWPVWQWEYQFMLFFEKYKKEKVI